jgi:predicted ArsR family transcriptional regulator
MRVSAEPDPGLNHHSRPISREKITKDFWIAMQEFTEHNLAVETFNKIQGVVVSHAQSESSVARANVSLERDVFLRTLIRELAGTLQDVVGLEEASGFISVVGQRMGMQINEDYKTALSVSKLNRAQVADVLVDLKRRIQGEFFVIEETDDKIVLGNRRCPFADKVIGRPAMCMMTSNVFGSIAAQNLGYAKVMLEETIAQGAASCRVTVFLKPTPEAQEAPGREYLGD